MVTITLSTDEQQLLTELLAAAQAWPARLEKEFGEIEPDYYAHYELAKARSNQELSTGILAQLSWATA